ncbi:hypothetical protein DESC_480062 [Desulfosarcina cetonica]|nr:hypothetical protein DESC_480062 [Desulfosarcina cetonica]
MRGPDPGLRQVPFLRQGSGGHRRHSAPFGRGAVQRRLLGHPDRRGPGRRLQLRGQRSAALHDPLLVRAEGLRDPAFTPAPGHQEHPPGSQPAGFHYPQCAGCAGEKLQHHAHWDAGWGPESHPGISQGFEVVFLSGGIGRRGMTHTAFSPWPCQKHDLNPCHQGRQYLLLRV